MNLNIDRDYLVETLAELVGINSVNPELFAGGGGEVEIADYVAHELRRLGLEVALLEPKPNRPSVVGRLPGSGQGRSLMLNGHLDTVGVAGMKSPFNPEIFGGKLYGRGAYDMKGSLAACLAAVKALVEAGERPEGDLLVAAVADEEYVSLGTAEVIKCCRVDGAIVTEPTEMKLSLAHKGFMWLEVETFGRAAHGSRFDLGIDANRHMGRLLVELDKLAQELQERPGHPLVGPPSVHAGTLAGGTALSVYAANCRVGIERRTVPGEKKKRVVQEIQALVDKLSTADPQFQATLELLFAREPFEVSAQAGIVQAVEQAALETLGRPPEHSGEAYWADAALLSAAGVETVMIGPRGSGAHAAVEWVELDSLVELAAVLARTALNYCRGTSGQSSSPWNGR